jgi:hypothetical protein
MKNNPIVIALALFLAGCAAQIPTPQTIEVTRIVEVTQAVTPQAVPTPAAAQMAFPAECLTAQAGVDYSKYKMYTIHTIGWCSFMEPSPDGKYLAYSTMTCLSGPTPPPCGEAVKVLEVNSQEAKLVLFNKEGEHRLVWGLDWSSKGDLVITQTDINSPIDTWVMSWPIRSTKTLVPGGLKKWNDSRSAFFSLRGAGPGACGSNVSGYDFTSGKVFPDIAASLGLEGANMEVYRDMWWEGDSTILLLITPMKYDEQKQDDTFLPTIAGKITLSPSGPEYTSIASSASEDFYFVNDAESGYAVKSKPYEARTCFGE